MNNCYCPHNGNFLYNNPLKEKQRIDANPRKNFRFFFYSPTAEDFRNAESHTGMNNDKCLRIEVGRERLRQPWKMLETLEKRRRSNRRCERERVEKVEEGKRSAVEVVSRARFSCGEIGKI